MTRELDWRIHELMGNDLTGWEWTRGRLGDAGNRAMKRIDNGLNAYQTIPHYSSTWEGFGLMADAADTFQITKMPSIEGSTLGKTYRAIVNANKHVAYDESAPQALAKAFKAAMEERE